MTPSKIIVQEAVRALTTVDTKGRRLSLRRLTALDTLRLFKAAGPVLAQNEPWLAMAGLAFSVMEIDGVPVPAPATEAQIEMLVDRLGDDGLAAIADVMKDAYPAPEERTDVGNLQGTPY
jgi:hypothetical protein